MKKTRAIGISHYPPGKPKSTEELSRAEAIAFAEWIRDNGWKRVKGSLVEYKHPRMGKITGLENLYDKVYKFPLN